MDRTEAREGTASVLDEIEDATTVLILAPPMGEGVDRVCTDLLTPSEPRDQHLLYITFDHSPEERLRAWIDYVGEEPPATTGVISVGDAVNGSEGLSWPDGSPVSIETLSSPTDLTGLAMRIGSAISRWQRDGRRPVVCVHSLTTLLQYADLDRVFRFLNATADRLEACDALAHFHMTREAHDSREFSTLVSVFDAAVRMEDDGSWEVQTR